MKGPQARIAGLALATVSLLPLGAVALRAGASSGVDAVREVRIVVHHSRFEPDALEVARGETVRFVLENTDPIDHEFIVGDARLQLVHERGTEAHHPPRSGEITVPAGTTRSTTVTFPRDLDATLFGCHLPGHYAYGMVGTIEVR
ncbi:MAG: cupredoxin domain-containing protein [Actinomycetota bacterium]